MDLIRKDAGLQEAFGNLSPELKSVLDAAHGANPPVGNPASETR
jgi:hypothetical protein